MNYNMQGMEKTIPELFAMLKAAEVDIKKEHCRGIVTADVLAKGLSRGAIVTG